MPPPPPAQPKPRRQMLKAAANGTHISLKFRGLELLIKPVNLARPIPLLALGNIGQDIGKRRTKHRFWSTGAQARA